MSDISKIYTQYEDSLGISQHDYAERLKHFSKILKKEYDEYLKDYIYDFSYLYKNQIERLNIKSYANHFFGNIEKIPFVAIDGSCFKHASSSFISLYGGAYGAKGNLSLTGQDAKVTYEKWELSKDVSMVAFVPIPPDSIGMAIDDEEDTMLTTPPAFSDNEISEISSLHTKLMQLAEIYLAYSLAKSSTVDPPRVILMDNSLSGILGNSSFSPKSVRMTIGDFSGEQISLFDIYVALAHPFNKNLNVPSVKKFQPHNRLIAETTWLNKRSIKASECNGFPEENFVRACRFFKNENFGEYNEVKNEFIFKNDPRASWQKTIRIFEYICNRLFREKNPSGLTYALCENPGTCHYFTPRDLSFLIGIGIRSLVEICWERNILLIGIVKDSNSRFYYRNYVGSSIVLKKVNPLHHLSIPLSDRSIIEILPNIDEALQAPWGTFEFDSCFMTLHPEKKDDKWVIKGYEHPGLGETTRPERIFSRSIAQFLLTPQRDIASHALFIDRLVHPGWDDIDSENIAINTEWFGKINPLYYDIKKGPPRLQKLTNLMLTILVRNHFPEALGYPDPLHQADWGAKSMERRVRILLMSSEWAFRANPLSKTFREIRDSFR